MLIVFIPWLMAEDEDDDDDDGDEPEDWPGGEMVMWVGMDIGRPDCCWSDI